MPLPTSQVSTFKLHLHSVNPEPQTKTSAMSCVLHTLSQQTHIIAYSLKPAIRADTETGLTGCAIALKRSELRHGNPVEIAAAVAWRVEDTATAALRRGRL